ncbi:transglycosylase SLT domain-containing protein [Pasteurella multocida]|uniref:transglycosylase SLT domain-containing protein n=1 Tax=Pasteurella multocida TaxID=747 RepID=UPI002C606DBD|nr:transglycosylase SLT domain-containing protein [Pasteurella multocida]MEB3496507.1 transglycosylase SLT domain-containing protein [Pasteurella multocida]
MRRLYALFIVLVALVISPVFATTSTQYKRILMQESHANWGLNAPIAVFAAQVHQESNWNVKAISPVGAQGLTQFMPSTAKWIAERYPSLAINQPFNPNWALRALVVYNKYHYNKIVAKTECDRIAFTLSAYNGGLGWVLRDKKKAKVQGLDPLLYWNNVEQVNAGRSRSNFAENRGYPKRIIYYWQPRYITWGNTVCLHD